MGMDPVTIGTIIATIITAIAGTEGAKFYIGRRKKQSNGQNENNHDGLTQAIEEIKDAIKGQTKQLGKLTIQVITLEGKLDTAIAETDAKIATSFREHESRLHTRRRKDDSGDYK